MISTHFYRILRDAVSTMTADQVAQTLDLVAKDREFVSTCKIFEIDRLSMLKEYDEVIEILSSEFRKKTKKENKI